MYLQLEKFNTFRGKEKKDRHKGGDRTSFRPPGMEELSYDGTGDVEVQTLINRMTEHEVNSKFEQMLVGQLLFIL